MPVYNITVDDSSPMFIYSQGWTDSNSSDSQLLSYSNGTLHATSDQGATAKFTFFGNAIYLFGALRPGYGPFSVSVDGGEETSGNAAASGSALFQQVLFNRTGLSNGDHTLVLTNNGTGTFVDIDFITFTTGDGNSSTPLGNSTIDDTSPVITYKPSGSAWTTSNSQAGSYYNSTLHAASQPGAQAVIPFTGDAVSVFGATSPEHGTFSVQIDGHETVTLNGTAPTFRPQTLLYWAGGLGAGQHNATVTNTDSQLNFDFDDLVASTWTATAVASPTPTHQSTAKTPIIAGAISGTCVGVAWIIALFLVLRRRRRRRHLRQTADLNEAKPEPFILPPDPAVVQGSHRPGEYVFENRPSSKALPPRPAAAAAASTSSIPQTHTQMRSMDSSSRSRAGNPSSSSSRALASTSGARDTVVSDAAASSSALGGSGSQSRNNPSGPPESVEQGTSRPSISTTELSTRRMIVPNRPQDWGPITLSHEEDEQELPPDYQQAIQPMPPVASRVTSSGSP